MRRGTSVFAVAVLATIGVGYLILQPIEGVSKPPRMNIATLEAKKKARQKQLETDWAPVRTAVTKGDVSATKRAVADFEAEGNILWYFTRHRLAEFYKGRGALDEAKETLEPIVHPKAFQFVRILHGRRVTYGLPASYDATTCLLWLSLAKSAPEREKTDVINRWAEGYRKERLRPGAFPDLSSEALLHFAAGQELSASSSTYREAEKEYELAAILAPNSIDVARALIAGARFAGDHAMARQAAINAAKLTNDVPFQHALLAEGGVAYSDFIKRP